MCKGTEAWNRAVCSEGNKSFKVGEQRPGLKSQPHHSPVSLDQLFSLSS